MEGYILCFDAVCSAKNLRIAFKLYKRYTPINLRRLTVYEMYLVDSRETKTLESLEESALVQGLQDLSLEPTDSEETIASDETSRFVVQREVPKIIAVLSN
jgi:hypothetical protein